MVDDLLFDGRLRARGVFDDRAVAGIWQEHRSGARIIAIGCGAW